MRAELSDADILFISSSHENLHLQDKRSIKYEISAKLDCGICVYQYVVNVKIISLSREQTVSSGILARAVMSTHCQAVFKAQSGMPHAFSLAEHLCD